MIPNPKFEKHLQEAIDYSNRQMSKDRYGIVMAYDRSTNTATVLLSSSESDIPGDVITNVPCPVYAGIQLVAPEPGRPCWVTYKGNSESQPFITHYFNHSYQKFDYKRQYQSSSGVPNFVTQM